MQEKTPIRDLMNDLTGHIMKNGRRFRGLDPVGKDRELLLALGDPGYRISGLTNKKLREQLSDTTFASGRTDKQLSSKVSRHLRLLRVH